MGRMTRKQAAEIAEQLHVDEDALLEIPGEEAAVFAKTSVKGATPEPTERQPLGEIAPNSAESKSQQEDEGQELRKSIRGKKCKKGGAKGKNNDLAVSTATEQDVSIEHVSQDVLPDEHESAPSPASEKAAEDLMAEVPELAIQDTSRPTSPPSPAVKLTRSQLKRRAEEETEPKSLIDGIGQTPDESETMKEETPQDSLTAAETNQSIDPMLEVESPSAFDAPTSPLPSAVPNFIKHLRNETSGKRSTSNKENVEPEEPMATPQTPNYDELENAVVSTTGTPSRSSQLTPVTHDPVIALDQLDDAVETVNKDIPEVQTSPEKPKKSTTPPKKAAPVVRTTKAAAARISMAHNKDTASKGPTLGRPQPSMALGRSSSLRESSSVRPVPTGKRVTSTSSTKDDKAPECEKKEVVIPHSKTRPISMSFPTPPPPPKSRKAPTQSTFQLPGEAVAAKLKAAREARQQKEAQEEEKKPAFKARPVPAGLSKAPSVRQTNASKARESVMNGKDFKMLTTAASAAHKRANSVATTKPTATTSRVVSRETKPTTASMTTRPRPSTSLANLSKPRSSTGPAATTTTTQRVTSSGSATGKGTTKGKEVFNRAAVAKANADKEKAEREAAVKKAKADAAERSRQASREFAEKQRARKAAAAAGKQAVGLGGVAETA
ncbi:uncharacterized protein LTR77_004560 [Saxophila tyrrhenica]|uniref:Uncharacterized protein n=1 Tax=Saxophila tyrrhenica TaxID=1690608 RepID=A0AAV9PD55_9PEZI|nr:hypothetical protein LTR77_004560 [Saxophila tyrrhenica]